ncbi:helix-turn-helix domain-containing protein [Fodinicola feengrottensis]|uniref:HTH cro/C1-type domain-containing protein n=1 Tax=Fodinicola feengrottensis TaxID=435914 RepID=A0ABN2G8B6_9ACTN|nr:helix-turn-helix transcriptional regulator [Fodinicola feengrottensis]
MDERTRVVGRRIAAARTAQGLSQRELATRANVSIWLLRKVEQGVQGPTVAFLTAVCKVLALDERSLNAYQRRHY